MGSHSVTHWLPPPLSADSQSWQSPLMSPTPFSCSAAMSSIPTMSPGVAQSGVADQYADGKAAKNWQLYIGEQKERTTKYKNFLVNLLKQKKAVTILDAACGSGVDSVMLIEEMGGNPAFSLTSCDYSDKMLKGALKTRWDRRREQAFFDWTIEEGNWMTLTKDVKTPGAGYDAIICMGNSFPHLIDDHGDLRDQKTCIQNFYDMLKPGGTLVIDHRNYDYILEHGKSPTNNIYYNSQHISKITTQIIYENNKAKRIVLNYKMDVDEDADFVLSYQPYTLAEFDTLLEGVFGPSASHTTFADFKALAEVKDPAFYVHVIEKPARK